MNKKLIHTLFEAQARRVPDKPAVQEMQRHITYRDLNARANQLAHQLRALSIQPESVVGVMMGSSIHLIIAVLGVFKSSGVYLPIDLAFPGKRLSQIFAQSTPEVIITTTELHTKVTALLQELDIPAPLILALDEEGRCAGADFPGTDPEIINHPDDGNYIFYTSGSTGQAKGFLGCHKSLSHFIHWELKEFGIDETCRVSQLSQFTFDASLRDIFLPLSCGGTLYIPDADTKANTIQLIQWLAEHRISLVHCVPSVFRLITRELQQCPRPNVLPHLQYVLMAGEPLYVKDIRSWRQAVGGHAEIVNLYGTSETTLAKTFHRIGALADNPNQPIHAGRPIDNAAVLILNDGIPCAPGETGHIYIRTPFRTKGYYRNEALNREVFVQNPLVDYPDILHKTGDLGRFLPDGQIEVLGRTDDQVKVNGIRVTLGEVKQAVLGAPGVQEAVVTVQQNQEQENELVCYYTGSTGVDALKASLQDTLNANVTPSFFIRMDRFPLTANGKVDIRALPKPESLVVEDALYEPARPGMEAALEEIWKELLHLGRIGRKASFFRIGGTSLKAIQLVSQVYRQFNVQVRINDIFAHPTIAQLAACIAGRRQETAGIPLVKEQPHYAVTHAQQRLWILDQLEGEKTAYNMIGSFLFKGPLDLPALEKAFRSLIRRHEILRCTFLTVNGEPRFKVHPEETVDFRLQYQDLTAELFARKIANDIAGDKLHEPFDLSAGPLLRLCLLKVGHDEHVLLFTTHHIISDGWSIEVMVKELLLLYNGYAYGKAVTLPPLKIQYKDYAAWLNEQLSGEKLQALRRYWLSRFEDAPVMQLPVDYPRPEIKTTHGAIQVFEMDAALTAGIKALVREEEVSVFMFLLAAVNLLLYRYSGQDDIVVGAPIAGRVHKDLEDQLGLYVNLLALRNRLHLDHSFRQLLQQVKATLLGAYEHQLYPFDQLVKELNLPHDSSRAPLTDVWVQHSDNPWDQLTGYDHKLLGNQDLVVAPFDATYTISKVDLTFKFTETNGRIEVILEYNTSLFKKDTIGKMRDELLQLTADLLTYPGRPLKETVCTPAGAGQLAALVEESISNEY